MHLDNHRQKAKSAYKNPKAMLGVALEVFVKVEPVACTVHSSTFKTARCFQSRDGHLASSFRNPPNIVFSDYINTKTTKRMWKLSSFTWKKNIPTLSLAISSRTQIGWPNTLVSTNCRNELLEKDNHNHHHQLFWRQYFSSLVTPQISELGLKRTIILIIESSVDYFVG